MAELSFCLLSTFYPPANFGGDGVHVRRLARGLASRGHRVRVLYNPDAFRLLAPGRPVPGLPDDPGVEAVPVALGGVGTAVTYMTGRSMSRMATLASLVAGFDVVHLHNPSLLGGPAAFGLGEGLRLYTTHEHWLLCPTHVLFRNNSEVCTQRTCVRCTLHHRRPPQPWRVGPLLAKAVERVDVLLCPSRFTADLHRAHFPQAAVEVLPLPVPEHAPAAVPSGLPEIVKRPFFLYAGRLARIKGVHTLVRAFRRVKGADLVIAGTGEEVEQLRALAQGAAQIHFLGQVSHDQVLQLCADALAVVIPSVGYETFGGVAVEAMARGRPAVVRQLGPLPELVETGGGLTFRDDEHLVAVLQQLVNDPALADRLGIEAQAQSGARFGDVGFFNRYLAVVAKYSGSAAVRRRRPGLAARAAATAHPSASTGI